MRQVRCRLRSSACLTSALRSQFGSCRTVLTVCVGRSTRQYRLGTRSEPLLNTLEHFVALSVAVSIASALAFAVGADRPYYRVRRLACFTTSKQINTRSFLLLAPSSIHRFLDLLGRSVCLHLLVCVHGLISPGIPDRSVCYFGLILLLHWQSTSPIIMSDSSSSSYQPPSPSNPKPLSSVQPSSDSLSLEDLHSQHAAPANTAFATLASSLGLAKTTLLKNWNSASFDGPRSLIDSLTAPSSPEKNDQTPSTSPSVLHNFISRSSTAVGQGIKSLTNREPNSKPDESAVHDENTSDDPFMFEAPPLDPIRLVGYAPRTRSRLLTSSLAEEIRTLIPPRNQLHESWTLLYSLEQHGASLSTLYSNNTPSPSSTSRPGYVLIVRDRSGSVFGAYANEHFHPSELKRFYGTGDCFLWKYTVPATAPTNASTDSVNSISSGGPRFKAFPYVGANDFVIFCTPQFLSMGGGNGHYGLWIDNNLERGVSSACLTFANEPLSNLGTKFDVVGLEVWRVGPA